MALLGEKAVGDIVKIKENDEPVNYIIVHKGLPDSAYDSSCDGVWLLRETLYTGPGWTNISSNDYENSYINEWLNSTFLNTIDSKIRETIKSVKIPFKKGFGNASTGIQTGSNGLSCKAFLLSGYEVGFTKVTSQYFHAEGTKLSYFSDDVSRIAKDSIDRDNYWWLRSPYKDDAEDVWLVDGYGKSKHYTAVQYRFSVRPAFILPPTLVVSKNGMVSINLLPTITSDTTNGSDPGELSAPFDLTYSVNDEDGDAVTVTEYLDDVPTRTYTAVPGAENTFEALSDPLLFQKIINGQHTIKIIANDTKDDSDLYTVTFSKQVKTAVISLENPLPADDVIKAAVISITGKFSYDATFEFLVTNNALDENPVWEDMSREVLQATNHVFVNRTAQNGFAFNFKITVNRGASDEQGFIEKIGGAFE